MSITVLACVGLPRLLDVIWGNVPIVFYGEVVDNEGRGVPEAEVTMHVVAEKRLSIPVPFAPNQTGWLVTTTTDRNGNFTIVGQRGTVLNLVDVKKAGYGMATLTRSGDTFVYTSRISGVQPYHSDPARPAVFRLPRLKG